LFHYRRGLLNMNQRLARGPVAERNTLDCHAPALISSVAADVSDEEASSGLGVEETLPSKSVSFRFSIVWLFFFEFDAAPLLRCQALIGGD
jgi:hypothetical protein